MSYGWREVLSANIAPGDGVTMNAPGASNEDCKRDQAEVAVGAQVIPAGKFTITVDDSTPGAERINVKNAGDADWAAGAEVYVYAPSLGAADVITQGVKNTKTIDELDERVDVLEEAPPPETTRKKGR